MLPLSEAFARINGLIRASRRGIGDVLVSLVAQGASLVGGVIGAALLARGFGPARMGEFALISSLSSFTALLSDLGIGGTAIRYTARAVSNGDTAGQFAVLRWAFRLRMVLVAVVSICAFAVIPTLAGRLWHAGALSPIMRFSLLIGAFGAVSSIPLAYFQSRRRFRASSAVTVAQALLTLASLCGLWWFDAWNLWAVVSVSVAVSGVLALATFLVIPRRAFASPDDIPRLPPGVGRLRHLLRPPSLPAPGGPGLDATPVGAFATFMVLANVVIQVISRLDVWLMGSLRTSADIGVYSVASKFPLPLAMILGAVSSALWPRASAVTSAEGATAMLTRTVRLSGLLAAASAVYAFAAPLAAPLIFGHAYAPSTGTGQLLCLRYCVAIFALPVGLLGYCLGLVRASWIVSLLQLALVFVTNILLQPRIGPAGAALALVAHEVFGATAMAVLVMRRLRVLRAAPA